MPYDKINKSPACTVRRLGLAACLISPERGIHWIAHWKIGPAFFWPAMDDGSKLPNALLAGISAVLLSLHDSCTERSVASPMALSKPLMFSISRPQRAGQWLPGIRRDLEFPPTLLLQFIASPEASSTLQNLNSGR
jgi:hypothetical protein